MHSFQRKTPKSQKADTTPFTLYNPHTLDGKDQIWGDRIRVISIDPGTQNYCIRVEERPFTESCPNNTINMLLYEKFAIKKAESDLTNENQSLLYNILTNYLTKHLDLFKTCNLVIIERQLPENYKATRVAQHTITFFLIHLKDIQTFPLIIEVSPKLKGKELGASSNLNSRGLKSWAVEQAHELLTLRQDSVSLTCLAKSKKKDDLSDTVCQIEALFKYMGWPLSQAPRPRIKLVLV